MLLLQQENKDVSVVMMHRLFSSSGTAEGGRTPQKATDLHAEQLSNKRNKALRIRMGLAH